MSSVMHRSTTHRPRRSAAISRHNAPGSSSGDQPHARTVADMATECAALDCGYATWFSHQVEEVIAREEEDNRPVSRRLLVNDKPGK